MDSPSNRREFEGEVAERVTFLDGDTARTHVRMEGEEKARCGAAVPADAEDRWGDTWCDECFLFIFNGGRFGPPRTT